VTTLDLTGVACPLNWVKAKLALERVEPGGELELLLDPGEPVDSVSASAREAGHEVEVDGDRVRIVKSDGSGSPSKRGSDRNADTHSSR
jgi:tRNA 2-thiouridine synthesizing protein A